MAPEIRLWRRMLPAQTDAEFFAAVKSLKRFISVFLGLMLFCAAMAYLESAVVVYLRALYSPDGSDLMLNRIPPQIIHIEIFREAATIIMLAAVSILAGHSRRQRTGAFIFCFGIWDIFYYIWLKILINWPAGLMDRDILFLIPTIWVGPVLAPVLISVGLVVTGIVLFIRTVSERPVRNRWLSWILIPGGCGLMIESFLVQNP